ncbi:MAG: protein kinase, partial [Thermoanaerobaculaceae bacterium]|nr:protein kinase [Thermoanaerobaculaceae bacterium]
MRYDTGVPIGSGGMGTVIRSFDPVLGRHVAIKILRRDEPELAERMLREARAQASVDHPNVAKVYEVGYLEDGRPFIAMQLIEGRPLDEVAPGLTLDQRIQLVATVAEAVQAAHAIGLVHRDLKPSNILVEESPEHGLRPFVVDFGIAREEAAPGPTVSGQVVGTPGYMAPEQASGAARTLDRRADIFSLGVILYELVGSGHPFGGDSAVEKLVSLLHDEPAPLRARASHVPADLEAVIFKCLEKRPEHRYASARALADELRRYLGGEPVEARRVTRIGILWRRAKRHPAMAATVAVATLAVIVAGGVVMASVAGARRQAREAQELGQRVARTDAVMRIAHLLPPHDLGRERGLVRDEMAQVRRDMARFRGLAHTAGHYALGRGHLVLGEPEDARRELEEAWRQGYRTADVALASARAHAELFRARLDRVRRQRDEEARQVGLELAERELRQPALRLLEAVGGQASQEAVLVHGLLELAAREPSGALSRADELAGLDPGSAEASARADALRGEAHLQQAKELRWGKDRSSQGRALGHAREAFDRAIQTLRSDPTSHLGLCRAWNATVEAEADAGTDPAASLAHTEEACRLAARIDTTHPAPLNELGAAHATVAQFRSRRGHDPLPSLDRAEQMAEDARRADPASYEAATLRGTSLVL